MRISIQNADKLTISTVLDRATIALYYAEMYMSILIRPK